MERKKATIPFLWYFKYLHCGNICVEKFEKYRDLLDRWMQIQK